MDYIAEAKKFIQRAQDASNPEVISRIWRWPIGTSPKRSGTGHRAQRRTAKAELTAASSEGIGGVTRVSLLRA
jgi:hypothetical protein